MGLGGLAGTDPILQNHLPSLSGRVIMSWRRVPFVKGTAVAVAVFLLLAPQLLAGPGVRGRNPTTPPPKPIPATVARVTPSAITIAIVVEPPRPATEPLTVGLRGPDGQVRRFP